MRSSAYAFAAAGILAACSSSSSGEVAAGNVKPCLVTRALTSAGEVGGLAMYVHVPPGTPTDIVVALHGCTQRASDYERAGWNDIADANDLITDLQPSFCGRSPSDHADEPESLGIQLQLDAETDEVAVDHCVKIVELVWCQVVLPHVAVEKDGHPIVYLPGGVPCRSGDDRGGQLPYVVDLASGIDAGGGE